MGRRHNLLAGGARSGKTFIYVKHVVRRALIAERSRHAILRYRGNAAKASIRLDTLPKVCRLCFPRLRYETHEQDGYVEMPNGSEIWIGGLDEKERVEKILGNEYCLHPDSKVLMADLTWRRAEDVAKGDEIIAFPEDLVGQQKLIRAKIEFNKPIQRRRFRVVTTKGETIVSEGHKFVAYFDDRRARAFRPLSWVTAEKLVPGDKLRFATAPWATDKSYDGGWLAGIFDGEGWVTVSGQVGVSQNVGPILDRVKELLIDRGVEFHEFGHRSCHTLRPATLWQKMRVLGSLRPVRLMERADLLWENKNGFNGHGDAAGSMSRHKIKSDARHVAEILSIEELPVGEVRSIQTSSKTLIHDGFLGHNCTMFYNECSQIPYSSVLVGRTRLAQVCYDSRGRRLIQQELLDLNPVGKTHYSHREFIQGVNPESRRPIPDFATEYYADFVQPKDNAPNLDPIFLRDLENAPERYRRRFFLGEYVDEIEGALWTMEAIDHARCMVEEVPETLTRVVVGVDPSGTKGEVDDRGADVGIVVAGRAGTGDQAKAYLLDDLTCNLAPEGWGKVVVGAYRQWQADRIVAEANFGGAMVKAVIESAARGMGLRPPPIEMVTASRGKAVRAEPISVLMGRQIGGGSWEGDVVRHAGDFPELEEELLNFSVHGYLGPKSPNRADAYVWAMSHLMVDERMRPVTISQEMLARARAMGPSRRTTVY